MEPTPAEPTPGSNYDFIMNPEKPRKRGLISLGGNSFLTKILLIVGGAVVLAALSAVVVGLFFDNKARLNVIVELTQSQQEIVRLGALGDDATNQETKNAAVNTLLSLESHQLEWLAFLEGRGREVKTEELGLKRDAGNDTTLETAKQNSTFDATYNTVMRTELEEHAALLKSTHQSASNEREKNLLSVQYNDVQLLLEQWPE